MVVELFGDLGAENSEALRLLVSFFLPSNRGVLQYVVITVAVVWLVLLLRMAQKEPPYTLSDVISVFSYTGVLRRSLLVF